MLQVKLSNLFNN